MSHYMRTIPKGCKCWHTEARDPAEPHLGTWLDAEPNPQCRVHFPALWRIRRLVEGEVVVGWVIEQRVQFHGMDDAEYVVVDYFPSGDAAIEAFASFGVVVV
ncbi:hypothetical protein SEA_HAMMY_61 [Mycobacterium phage Hammy]|nr:hypothetical protein SEA_HAMMY_61 [Mycobacterium phage Hammy]